MKFYDVQLLWQWTPFRLLVLKLSIHNFKNAQHKWCSRFKRHVRKTVKLIEFRGRKKMSKILRIYILLTPHCFLLSKRKLAPFSIWSCLFKMSHCNFVKNWQKKRNYDCCLIKILTKDINLISIYYCKHLKFGFERNKKEEKYK